MAPVVKSGLVIDAVSIGGSEHKNQDTWGMRNETFWILDGATAPNAQDNLTVSDYVQSLNDSLYAEAPAQTSLEHILRAALERTIGHPAAEAGFSATVAMVKKTDGGWEWLVLGDAAVIVEESDSELQLVSDQRLAEVAKPLRRARRKLKGNPATADRFHQLTAELRRQEGLHRNTPGGFWVASADPTAATQAVQGVAPPGTRIFLMTDGVTDGLEAQHWASLEAAVSDWETKGAAVALRHMREELLASQHVVDDATLVSVRDNT